MAVSPGDEDNPLILGRLFLQFCSVVHIPRANEYGTCNRIQMRVMAIPLALPLAATEIRRTRPHVAERHGTWVLRLPHRFVIGLLHTRLIRTHEGSRDGGALSRMTVQLRIISL